MKINIKVTGIDKLTEALNTERTNERLKKAVQVNAAQVHRKANRKVPVITGFLKRSIQPPSFSSDGMYAIVRATAEYAPYIEFGTRFRAAKPYMTPAFNEVRQKFLDDVKKAMVGK